MAEEIPVSKVIVRNTDNEFLLVKDSDTGKWELPGGKIEAEENRFQAAKREVETETSLKLDQLEDVVRLEIESDETINCFILYSNSFSGEIDTGEEIEGFRWVEADRVRKIEWHQDSSYNIVPMVYLDEYLESEVDYSNSGEEINVVKLLIRNNEGKFLAVQKTPEDKITSGEKYTLYGRMAGKWELPGGRFKGADNRFDAAKREIKEECGIEIQNIKDVMREEVEEENVVNTFILLTDDWEKEVKLSREHVAKRWVTPEEYLELDWHQDAGYGYPPMKYLDHYLDREKNY